MPTRPASARGRRAGPGRQRAKRARWKGPWRDAKGLRLSLLDGDRIVPLLSWHQVHNEAELGKALPQVKDAGWIPEDQVRLCVVCDGAPWIWQHAQSLFPHARHVLDSDHCTESLHKVAKAHSGASVQDVAGVEATMTRLSLGQVAAVLGGLRRMPAHAAEAAQAMASGWAYLDAHRGRTHDRQLRQGGYPLGSGGIASSNMCMCHVRLKRSGVWWYESNSNQMLALRGAKDNGTFDQVLTRHQQRRREA